MKPALLATPWAKARAAAVGVILLMLTGGAVVLSRPGAGAAAMPGPLTSDHAALADRCDACHLATTTAVKGLLHGVAVSNTSLEESRHCLQCHDIGAHAMLAHSLDEGALSAVTQRFASASAGARPPWALSVGASLQPPQTEHGEIACASCHHEHRGRNVSLTALTNNQCQSCHAAPFHGLADGHPPFEAYPHASETAIAFDHASHISTHFPAEPDKAPAACGACHAPSGDGAMLTLGYEASCADCHSERVFGAGRTGDAGYAFLTLPAIDVLSLEDLGVEIGRWPADSRYFDAAISPFMRLLLSADDATAEALASLGSPDALLDLMDADEAQAQGAAAIARAVTDLLHDLAARGQPAAIERIERALGRRLTPDQAAGLLAGLPPDALRAAAQQWLTEHADPDERDLPDDAVAVGGWRRSASDLRLVYRPAGHADPFLRAWLDVVASQPADAPSPALAAVADALRDPQSPGLCAKCHDVTAGAPRWRADSATTPAAPMTRFDHRPHTTMMDGHGCVDCHAFAAPGGVHARSGFAPLTADSCTDCHTPQAAGNSCLACHSYHAGAPSSPYATWGAIPR